MKIKSVKINNKRKDFEVRASGKTYAFPYVKARPSPTSGDPVARAYVDKEIGGEGFTYELQSGKTGTVHVEQILEYNRDPNYLRDLMLYKLTLEAQRERLVGLGRKRSLRGFRAYHQVNVALQELKQRYELIDRFLVISLIQQPIQLSCGSAQSPNDPAFGKWAFSDAPLSLHCQFIEQEISQIVGISIVF